MQINSIKTLPFKGNIIDSHAHIGLWFSNKGGAYHFGAQDLDQFIKEPLNISVNGAPQQDNVVKMLISNLDCMFEGGVHADERTGNSAILDVCKNNPKLVPLAVCQSNLTNGNASVIKKLLDENEGSFAGLKFHPECLPLEADNRLYDEYLRLASEKKLPCLFHSQGGNSAPEAIYKLAKRHRDVPVILGHMGAGAENHAKAIYVLLQSIDRGDARLYADISWVDWQNDLPVETPEHVLNVIDELKKRNALDRLLFGTDAPLGVFGEKHVEGISPKDAYERTVSSLKSAIKSKYKDDADEIIDKIFYKNTNELFFEKKWAQNLQSAAEISQKSVKKTMSKTKIGLITFGAAAVIGVLGGILYKYSKKDPQTKN